MLVLSIDTATPVAGVALVDDHKTRFEATANNGLNHSRNLMQNVDLVLRECSVSIKDLDAVAVTIGPGSFTGLRIGLATAKGLVLAANCAIIGIPTLDALAYSVSWAGGLICTVLNARKGEVYGALYLGGKEYPVRISEYMAVSPEVMNRRCIDVLGDRSIDEVTFVGDGVPVLKIQPDDRYTFRFPPDPGILSRASNGGRLAIKRLENGEKDDVFTLTPIYIRLSEAESRLEQQGGQEK
ncbi:MAG: tRNA (adenosine(37)-N6)-threonylcarbamoyltransferase complex dimerization subunit type 1 TsaB [Chitinophagales bacterium]